MVANIRLILLFIAVSGVIWFYKDWQYQREENHRLTENSRWQRLSDSLKYSQEILTKSELIEELKYNNKDLLEKIKNENIKLNRIEKIITQRLNYRDSVKTVIPATGLAQAVKEKTPFKVAVIDSTKCLTIKGAIVFDGEEIALNIEDRKFNNITDVVTFWERNQWRFLGIKTRIFGKKKATVKVFNSCGETITKVIEKG